MTNIPSDPDARSPLVEFTYNPVLGNESVSIAFRYDDKGIIPSRVVALTGPSGSGKTTTLQALEASLRGDDSMGRFETTPPQFSNVVTYSQDRGSPIATPGRREPRDMIAETARDIRLMLELSHLDHLRFGLQPLAEETSFLNAGHNPLEPGDSDPNIWPTGQKLACSIVTRLAAGLMPGSLVIMDQPETFITPQIQPALMRGIQNILNTASSYAIIATSSPTILQEIPSQQVHVLTRHGSLTRVDPPVIETFAESAGLILTNVLDVNIEQQAYLEVINTLATQLGLGGSETMFLRGLSSQARALIMQRQGRNNNHRS